jgi:hypothetical protein
MQQLAQLAAAHESIQQQSAGGDESTAYGLIAVTQHLTSLCSNQHASNSSK